MGTLTEEPIWEDIYELADGDGVGPATEGRSNDPHQNLANRTAWLKEQLQVIKDELNPIGSIYTNADSDENPATLLGFGTWEMFGMGKVLVGVDPNDSTFHDRGMTGGSKNATVASHSHSVNIQSGSENRNHQHSGQTGAAGLHRHGIVGNDRGTNDGQLYAPGLYKDDAERTASDDRSCGYEGNHYHLLSVGDNNASHQHTVSGATAIAGSSGTNANLPPYVTVYIWRRTA